MKKLIIKKGYTVEVVSWENDGDNYKTKSQTYSTKEEALLVKKMCNTLFKSSNNGEAGIGNLMDTDEEQAKPIIIEYLSKNPEIFEFSNNLISPLELEEEIRESFPDENIGEEWIEYIHDYIDVKNKSLGEDWVNFALDYNYSLLGGSEYYYSRIVEKVSVFYAPEDVYLEEIE